MPINAVVGVALAAVVAVTSPAWARVVFESDRVESVLLLAAGVAAFGLYAGLGGMLSGLGRWGFFSALLIVDALTRLLLTVMAVAAGSGYRPSWSSTVAGTVSTAVVLMLFAWRTGKPSPATIRSSDDTRPSRRAGSQMCSTIAGVS